MNEPESHCGVRLAEAESLLGMLQRGRGAGYLRALEAPPETVWPLLLECITNDPRVDPHVEWRDEYYADLVAATGMDLQPLGPHLKRADETDQDVSLVLPTLFCLAKEHNHPQAFEIIEEYTSYGQNWEPILYEFSGPDPTDFLLRIVDIVCRRAKSEAEFRAEFEEEVASSWKWYSRDDKDERGRCGLLLPICEPWKTISQTNETLAGLFANVAIPYDPPPPPPRKAVPEDLVHLSAAALLTSVSSQNFHASWRVLDETVTLDDEDLLLNSVSSENEYQAMLALRELGRLGTPRAFEAVKSCIEACGSTPSRTRRYAFSAIAEIPGSLTLATARRWFHREEHHFYYPAGLILANHATLEDFDVLIEALHRPETLRRENCRLPVVLEALVRFKGIGIIPEIEEIFCQTNHSYDRGRAAEAMAATAPDHFASSYAFECLWDSHWGTRRPGCALVSLSIPAAIGRLRELSVDSSQPTDLQEMAQERLAGL